MKNPRTAIVAPYYPPQGGGLERYAEQVATRLKAQGVPVIVIASGAYRGEDSVTEVHGVTVYRLAYRYKFSNTPFAFNWYAKIKKILRDERIEILNIHTPVPGLGDTAALACGHRPYVVTYHAGSMKKPGARFAQNFAVWLYEHTLLPLLLNRAQHIAATSTFVSRFLHRPHKTTVVTPGVDSTAFAPAPKADTPTLLFVGGLSRAETHKGLDDLLEAVKKVSSQVPDVELVVVGDGDMKSVYEARAQELGLAARFTGRLEGQALALEYARSHLFVLPTYNDNFPMTILEAAASGTPAISTNIGSISDTLADGYSGYLVAPADIDALAQKVTHLLENPDIAGRMGDAARATVEREFDWDERANTYKKLLVREARTIVHISAYYPPHVGGIERVAQTAAHMQAAAGHRVRVLAANSHALTTVERHENLTIERLASTEFAHTPFAPTLLWKLLDLPQNSIVHLHVAQAYWADLVWLVMPLRHIPYIAHFHLDIEPSGLLGPLFVLYKKILWGPILRGARRVVVCSPAQIELVEAYGVSRQQIAVVPNGVGQEFFSSRSHVAPEGGLRLLSVGRLAPQKSLSTLVEAMSLLTVPAHLTIVGDGQERESLERLIEQKDLKNITLVGAKSSAEVRAYHSQADVFVISSHKEGLPLSVLEAMAAGLPVVATDVIGLRELLHGVGVLVEEPHARGIADALGDLWRNRSLLEIMSIRSRQKATEFAWPRFYEALEHAYDSLV